MSNLKKFKIGDKVFAKVKGYPAWPAMIVSHDKGRFSVKFYGTGETGFVKEKDMFYYRRYKKTFVKNLNRKSYSEAIFQIENDIEICGGDGDDPDECGEANTSVNISLNDTNKSDTPKRKLSLSSDRINNIPSKKKLKIRSSSTHDAPSSETDQSEAVSSTTINDSINHSLENNKSMAETNQPQSEEISNSIEKSETEIKNSTVASTSNNSLAIDDIKIVTDDYLEALVSYMDHIKKNQELYKKKPVEPREVWGNEVVLAKLPSGKYIGIKYNRDNPQSFTNEYDRAEYDNSEAKTILSLKELLEEGKCNPDEDRRLFEIELDITEPEIKLNINLHTMERKQLKLKRLKMESALIEVDVKIKGCLGLDKADPTLALESLDEMLKIDVDALTLKKHPHTVDMVKRLRRYIGNVKDWNLSPAECVKFNKEAARIRYKADEVYEKFIDLFNVSSELNFWDFFSKEVEKFKQQVKDMHETQIFTLSAEPDSRQAFLDSKDEEMKLILSKVDQHRRDMALVNGSDSSDSETEEPEESSSIV